MKKQEFSQPLSDATIADCLMENVYKHGSSMAYTYNGRMWSWIQIHMASEIVADELVTMGVRAGDHVAVCGYNSINWIITLFALSKIGAVAVLLNYGYQLPELMQALKLCDVKLLCYGACVALTTAPNMEEQIRNDSTCPTNQFFNFSESDYTKRMREYSFLDFEYVPTHDAKAAQKPACILLTSGSTGVPKAVCLTHYNVVNEAYETARFKADANDRTLLALPLFHSFGLSFFLSALVFHSCICLPASSHTADILETIDTYRCTMFPTVPTLALAVINNRSFVEYHTQQLRMVGVGGAALISAQYATIKQAFPETHIIALYGQTESAPGISTTLYEDTQEHICESVGLPYERMEVEIHVPNSLQRLADGEIGEIVQRGYNVMAGYYKIPPEKQPIDSEGWLHTGDLGRIDPVDGYLYINGRIKELIIRGGENIMPREVENAVCEYDDVLQCKVFGVPDTFLGEKVIACITLKPRNDYKEEKLFSLLQASLAKYKVPEKIFVLEAFPLTANGKVDVVTLKSDIQKRLVN